MVLYFLNLGVYYILTLLYVYPGGGDMQSVVSDDLGERQFNPAVVNHVFVAYKSGDDEVAAAECVHLFEGCDPEDIRKRSDAIAARLFRMGVPCEIARALVMMAVTMLDLGDEDEQDDQLRPGMVLVA